MARRGPKPTKPTQRPSAAAAPTPAELPAAPRGRRTTVGAKIAGVALMAALFGVLPAYVIPRPKAPGEKTSAWSRTHAARLVIASQFWGMSRDLKRAQSPDAQLGGDVFLFTKLWGALLDEHLMPQTKFRDYTRQEHIAYLMPSTGRRPIPPPSDSPDKRPPVVVGYGLTPAEFAPGPLPGMPQDKHAAAIALDEGHTLGQTFVTFDDYDLLDGIGLIVVPDESTPPGGAAVPAGCELVLYSRPDRKSIVLRASRPVLRAEDGMSILWFNFDEPQPAPRLKYNRGSTPYLLELTWRRRPGYTGPGPVFGYAQSDAYLGGEMVVDGERRPKSDLAFTVIGTHTDIEGYRAILPWGAHTDTSEWPGLFFAVRLDLPQPRPGEKVINYFKRLNEYLLKL